MRALKSIQCKANHPAVQTHTKQQIFIIFIHAGRANGFLALLSKVSSNYNMFVWAKESTKWHRIEPYQKEKKEKATGEFIFICVKTMCVTTYPRRHSHILFMTTIFLFCYRKLSNSVSQWGCLIWTSDCEFFEAIKLRPFRWISFRRRAAYRDHEIESLGKMFVIIAMQCVLWINIWNSQRNTEIHVAEHIKSKCWIANEYCWTFPFYQQFVVTCAYYSKVSNTTLHDKDKQQQTDIREKLIKLFERSPRMLL